MALPGRILSTKLESCRPKYSDKLLTKLNSLVHNPPLHTLYDNDRLQGGSTNFRGSKYKNKAFCGDNKLSSKPDAGDSLLGCINDTMKNSLTNLDTNIDVTAKQNVYNVTNKKSIDGLRGSYKTTKQII